MGNPLISFVVPMKEKDFRVINLLESIRKQNYPQNNIQIIIIDGGSNPTVLEACKKYNVEIYFNKYGFAEGKGMGKDQGIWKSKGKYVVISESDIKLVGENWINEMIEPLEKDEKFFASVPGLYVDKKDNIVNRYLSYVGVDPFAIFRSLEGQLALGKVELNDCGNYYCVNLNKKEPYCMGSNGFMFRKELIEKVGDYAQDVEFIARLVKNGFIKFAIPQNAKVFHANIKNFYEFLKKRIKWTKTYTKFYADEKKDFVWIINKYKFFIYVMKNIFILPNIPISIKNFFKYRDSAWFLHPFLLFLTTSINIFYSMQSKKMLHNLLK
jgi:GT2 family glycosyltransferase